MGKHVLKSFWRSSSCNLCLLKEWHCIFQEHSGILHWSYFVVVVTFYVTFLHKIKSYKSNSSLQKLITNRTMQSPWNNMMCSSFGMCRNYACRKSKLCGSFVNNVISKIIDDPKIAENYDDSIYYYSKKNLCRPTDEENQKPNSTLSPVAQCILALYRINKHCSSQFTPEENR